MTLVLIGAPGSGKTRLGKRVARIRGLPFIDTDRVIVAEHGPIPELFETYGEPHFRALERSAVAAALREPAIVSLGGGAVLDADTQRDLADHLVVLVTVSAEAVEARISNARRPLLKNGIEGWKALVESRSALYQRLGDRSWDTSTRPIDDIARDIAEWSSTARKENTP